MKAVVVHNCFLNGVAQEHPMLCLELWITTGAPGRVAISAFSTSAPPLQDISVLLLPDHDILSTRLQWESVVTLCCRSAADHLPTCVTPMLLD